MKPVWPSLMRPINSDGHTSSNHSVPISDHKTSAIDLLISIIVNGSVDDKKESKIVIHSLFVVY